MTGTLEIKITISECVTPALFQTMTAVSNPRQRAALLKRLAEEALRGSGTIADAASIAGSVTDEERHMSSVTPASAATDVDQLATQPRAEAHRAFTQTAAPNEEEGQFDYAFLADKLGDF
ncbi:hypothetical protein [Caballeronia sp. J97]|uniref:hypothetical protein n=1 Tax=Caballeronia sp. J97 TaxID=2805429 RepID=UPI002AB10BF6|nr:hypothetical protein [Caballeronia sp. J97]